MHVSVVVLFEDTLAQRIVPARFGVKTNVSSRLNAAAQRVVGVL